MVISTVQGIQQGSKDKRTFKRVWCLRLHHNNQMWTHGYKKKTGKQFLDFIDRIDQKYDSNVKQIFLVLDNASIHKSNKVKQTIAKYHSRIQFVFLPTRSPELNLIEVRWLWLHRQTINNSIFRNDYDIGKAVYLLGLSIIIKNM